MDILRDLKELMYDDREHHLKVEVSYEGVKGRLVLFQFFMKHQKISYIPDNELKDGFRTQEFGITLGEIVLIKRIMEYLEIHKPEIYEICYGYNCEDRRNVE